MMVTADRPYLAERAIWCFSQQSHPNRELVIVDDGTTDYSAIIDSSGSRGRIRYVRLPPRGESLGELRNRSIEEAHGSWIIQWDDDEWYHPRRIEIQLEAARRSGMGASALRSTLMRIDSDDGDHLEFRSDSGIATPGTIMFERGPDRYPALRRNEDGIFLRSIRRRVGVAVLGTEFSHLFVRIHHGRNTWNREHFLRKLHRTPSRWPSWMWANHVRGDVRKMRCFRLTSDEVSTIEALSSWDFDHSVVSA